jgi:RNA polymerase sigma-70 factor (ECF subfamily)
MEQWENQDDAWAVSRTLQGDAKAFSVIVRRYQGPIFRLMLRFSRDEHAAGEMAQDAFVRAFERLESYDPKRRFFTWLYTLSLNLARDHSRRSARTAFEHHGLELAGSDGGNDPLAILEGARLHDALRDLPPKYKEALALRYIEGMSLAEVAATLGLSMSGVKMRVNRALRMLRESYGENR